MPVAPTPTCTPEYLLNIAPCVKCSSQTDLLLVLLYIFMWINYDENDLEGVLADSTCWDCTSDKQKLEALVNMFGNVFIGEELNLQQLFERLACLKCVEPGRIKGAIVYELCKFFGNFRNA